MTEQQSSTTNETTDPSEVTEGSPAAAAQESAVETTPAGATETAQALESVATTEGDSRPAGDEASGPGDAPATEGMDRAAEGGDSPGGATAPRRARVSDLEREGEVAADFLETLLDIADLDGDLDVDVDGDRAAISIVDSEEGRVPRRLVGPDGKVLDALQELTRLAVQSVTGERSRLMLDVAGHRAERRSALVAIAQEAIEEVRRTGERKALEPMSAFEHKVVHDEVLAAGLSSESEGVEPRRCVVVQPTA